MLQFVKVLLRHRWVVVGASVALAFVLVVHGFLFSARSWTSTAAFTPQMGQMEGGRLRGLASQFGVNIPSSGSPGQSPAFYVDLLNSPGFLGRVVRSDYPASREAAGDSKLTDVGRLPGAKRVDPDKSGSRDGTDPGRPDTLARRGEGSGAAEVSRSTLTLVEAYGIEAESRAHATAAGVQRLKSNLSVDTDPESGLVRLSVSMPEPELARAVTSRMLELVHEFNLETRQSQASAERRFLKERVARAREDLLAAEDSLKRFLENNRRYENSPELVFEYQRLQRRVDLQQQIYTSLSQSLEEAKIEEVRNTPVITVVQEPERPVRPDGWGLRLRGIVGLFLGGMLGVFGAFSLEYVSRAREEQPDDYREVSALLAQVRGEVERFSSWIWEVLTRIAREGEGWLERVKKDSEIRKREK